MVIKKKALAKRITIDLTGPQGNAYFLLGTAEKYAEQLGIDQEKIKDEMKSGDYEHLVYIFDKYFGKFVTLLR